MKVEATIMKTEKKNRLEKAGWKVGSTQDFLGLSDAEAAIVEVRVALAHQLRARRAEQKCSQAHIAKLVGSSQSRIARMEAGDPSVTLDLLVHALAICGVTVAEIGRAITKSSSSTLRGSAGKHLKLANAAR